jgi:aminoglycoside phosphotransferase (APT) family kinase protein
VLPPPAALDWVKTILPPGSEIESVEPLLGSRWHVSHTLRIVGRRREPFDLILRRWARPGWDALDPDYDARREATVLGLVERLPVPTPRLVAADPDAQWCDVPAILITRLPGNPPPADPDDVEDFLRQLADALAAIHRLPCAQTDVPYYRPWSKLATVQPAGWARESPVWSRLSEHVRRPPPPSAEAFIHRDYHAGNTLWIGNRLAGIVDWSTGSWGPVSVDVAHMRWNLARELGPGVADRFVEWYRRTTGAGYEHDPYWDVVELIDGVATDPEPPRGAVRERLDRYVAGVLARLTR